VASHPLVTAPLLAIAITLPALYWNVRDLLEFREGWDRLLRVGLGVVMLIFELTALALVASKRYSLAFVFVTLGLLFFYLLILPMLIPQLRRELPDTGSGRLPIRAVLSLGGAGVGLVWLLNALGVYHH
jgi:hypothetical protein